MKNIPIIFPIALVLIMVATFFTGAYAVSEAALNGEDILAGKALAASAGLDPPAHEQPSSDDLEWFENAAIFICPLH